MHNYISILRGINVSGHRPIKMEALKKMYEGLKFKNVQTYIQSGNVIFQDKSDQPKELEKKISKKIMLEFGFEVPVIVLELSYLIEIVKNNPFVNERNEDIKSLHVTMLNEMPDQLNIDKIKGLLFGHDEFIIAGSAVYLFCPEGYGNSKLSNNFFESKLKVTATTRNWKTMNELLRLASGKRE